MANFDLAANPIHDMLTYRVSPPSRRRKTPGHFWTRLNRVRLLAESPGVTVITVRYENNSPYNRIQEITL